jgi:Flp pilus assembly protein protease CpaA
MSKSQVFILALALAGVVVVVAIMWWRQRKLKTLTNYDPEIAERARKQIAADRKDAIKKIEDRYADEIRDWNNRFNRR